MPYVNNQGIRIYYETEGEGPPLVLVHGRAASGEQWRVAGYVEGLQNDYRLVLIDARGHGRSDKPHDPQAYRKPLWAADVVAVLDDLRNGKAHFMGYSMGGTVGFSIAKYVPERFISLMIGGQDPYEPDTDGPNPRERAIQLFRQGMDAFLAANERGWGPAWTPEVKAILQASDLEALIAQYAVRERVGLVDALASLMVPCLLYVGEDDGHYVNAKKASEIMPNATFVSFPGLHHIEVLCNSELVLPHIREFLAEVCETWQSQKLAGLTLPAGAAHLAYEVCSSPNWTGVAQERFFELDGDRLSLARPQGFPENTWGLGSAATARAWVVSGRCGSGCGGMRKGPQYGQ